MESTRNRYPSSLAKGRGEDGAFGTSNLLVTYSSTVGLFFSPEVSLDLREVGERKIKRPRWGGCEGGERRKKPRGCCLFLHPALSTLYFITIRFLECSQLEPLWIREPLDHSIVLSYYDEVPQTHKRALTNSRL